MRIGKLLFYSIFLFGTLFITVTAVLFSISYSRYAHDREIKSSEMHLRDVGKIISMRMKEIQGLSFMISTNPQILEILGKGKTSLMVQLRDKKIVRDLLVSYTAPMEYIRNIYCYTDAYQPNIEGANLPVAAGPLQGFGLASLDQYRSFIMNEILYEYGDSILITLYNHPEFQHSVLNTLQEVRDLNGDILGILSISVDYEYMFEGLYSKASSPDELFIMDANGRYVFHAGGKRIGESVETALLEAMESFIGEPVETELAGKKILLSSLVLDDLDWILFRSIPRSAVYGNLKNTSRNMLLISAMILLGAAGFSLWLSRLLTHPLDHLVEVFIGYPANPNPVISHESRISEIADLNSQFRKMVNRINTLNRDVTESQRKKKDAEFKALQVQINPHFLYNTLDTLNWLTDQPEVAEITVNLGKFFRLSLNRGREIIPIKEELELIRSFLEIQKIRFDESFSWTEDVDEAVLEFPIIKIILQPLVENSLVHGFKYRKDGGEIHIRIRKRNERIDFEVEDNGGGVDLDRIADILRDPEDSDSYGISNVNDRLVLKYGDSAGLKYGHVLSGGTVVAFSIPGEQEGEDV